MPATTAARPQTRATPKPGRVMRSVTTLTPFDGLQVIRFEIAERNQTDRYAAIHWSDSCEVRVCHSDDESRSYRVTCSASTRQPLWCTCPARVQVCRHKAAVSKLTEMGLIEFPHMEEAGHDRAATE